MTSLNGLGAIGSEQTSLNGANNSPTSQELVSSQQFLQLLVAQLQNQNPLEPMEGTEYVTQLAEFANLEQLTQVNDGITAVNAGQAYQLSQDSIQMLGRTITYDGNEVVLPEDGEVELNYQLNGAAGDLTISVYDDTGIQVGTVTNAPRSAGLNTFSWDGTVTTEDGESTLSGGEYRFEVRALDGDQPVASRTYGSGRVTGVTFLNGAVELILGDKVVLPNQVLKVTE